MAFFIVLVILWLNFKLWWCVSYLLDIDGRVVPGQSGLLVRHNEGEDGGDADLGGDLSQPQHKQVRPGVPHQTDLRLVSANRNMN